MGHTHMLDTNIVSDLIRNPHGVVTHKITQLGEGSICISVLVAAEIRFGCAKRGSAKLTQQAETILRCLTTLPIEPPADQHYADIRHQLEQQGKPIGPNDLIIAAHARSLGLTLVTANDSEFLRVDGLHVENWL